MNVKLVLTLCASAFLLASCQNEDALDSISNEAVATRSVVAENVPYFVTADGALNFRSAKDYFALCDSLAQMDNDEFQIWELMNGFESYRSYTKKLIDEVTVVMENDSTQVDALLNKYKDYICLDEDREGVSALIQSRTYQNIANKNGVFYVNGVKNVVDAHYVTLESPIQTRSLHRIEYLNPIASKARDVNSQLNFKEFPYVKGKKKVIALPYILKNTAFTDVNGDSQTIVQFQIKLRGKAKKMFGGFKDYDTTFLIAELQCKFNDIPHGIDSEGNAIDYRTKDLVEMPETAVPGEDKVIYFVRNLMNFSVKKYEHQLQDPYCIHFRAASRATTPEGVGYNYLSGGRYITDIQGNIPGINDTFCPIHGKVSSRDGE